MSRNVLVVGINYAPEHTGIAPYTTQACEYLADSGHRVFTLTGVPHYPQWTVPAEYRWKLRADEQHGAVRLRRLRHFIPANQSAATRAIYELTFGTNVAMQRNLPRPDVVLTIVPSLAGAAAAAVLARRFGARLIVWVQDLLGPATAQSGIAGGSAISGQTTRLENWVLRRADRVLVLNESFGKYVAGVGVPAAKISRMPNWSHVAAPEGDRDLVRKRLGWEDGDIVALHSGNMGFKQGLENVVNAARLASDRGSKVRFVLMGDGNQRKVLEELAGGIPNLTFLPPADAEDFSNVLAAADVLLVNERASVLDMSLPSKLTSYFRAGMPVIAAVPGLGGTAHEVRRSGAGVVVEPEDAEALLDGIAELTDDDNLLQTFRLAAHAHALESLGAEASLRLLEEAIRELSQPSAVAS